MCEEVHCGGDAVRDNNNNNIEDIEDEGPIKEEYRARGMGDGSYSGPKRGAWKAWGDGRKKSDTVSYLSV